ncbi:constitutive coactivator of peroxisome proliferator-activated receptor gamma-like [Armigeres subalbatus]|uniref:constitutive coactivator of peroxisome proliferator-activated receptor gamma-like n=1 Tax=Armigeres subalbatus TaxID=124917 RepID=UPI002ED43EAE
MGVKGLNYFAYNRLPNGTCPIRIKDEIRKYYDSFPDAPPPIIVVDLKCLVYPFLRLDPAGVICGGRFNFIATRMDRFFTDLTTLGAKLEFFCDGPIRNATSEKWCMKKDDYYRRMELLFDAVDSDKELSMIQSSTDLPFDYVCTIKTIAMKHGPFHWAVTNECDQEMAHFANQSKSLAIMTDDSDFMIYEGSFRFWCVSKLNVENLTLFEIDRVGLVRHLRLSPNQMPLLATLVGNDVVDSIKIQRFHKSLGRTSETIRNVAAFIRNQQQIAVGQIFDKVLTINSTRSGELKSTFQKSYDSYQKTFEPFNLEHTSDPIEAVLLSRKAPLFYQLWHSKNIECFPGVIDLRHDQLGKQVTLARVSLILRMGGIILYHRQVSRKTKCSVMVKLDHDSAHAVQPRFVIFPTRMEPPPLTDLLSNDPALCDELQGIKWKLLWWVVSETFDQRGIETVPEPMQIAVVTLYWLMDNRILELYEADLLLQVAHDVTFDKYDLEAVEYPEKLASRPFRVAFLFPLLYSLIASVFNLVGLPGSRYENPPFDGALFHSRYNGWKERSLNGSARWDGIEEMRIYSSIITRPSTD